MSGGIRERVLGFLAEYGERGYSVLRAAVEAASTPRGRGVRLGDFNSREVAQRLRAWGIQYNPSMLLRILERDYAVIETSYRSSNQHWYRFLDIDAVVEALEEYDRGIEPVAGEETGEDGAGNLEDPEQMLLIVQIASLDPYTLLERLRRLAVKPRLSSSDLAALRRLAFNELENVAALLRRAEELGYEGEEVEALRQVLTLALRLARRLLAQGKVSSSAARTVETLARLGARTPHT